MKLSVGVQSAIIYIGVSVLAAGSFLLATWPGGYNWLTRFGGAGWVFLLSMIILMPLVTQRVKKRSSK